MLGNYQNLPMDTMMFQNFTPFLFPHHPFPGQQTIFPTNASISTFDFSMPKWNGNFTGNSNSFARIDQSPPYQSPTLSIPNMVANTSGFNFLPQFNQNFSSLAQLASPNTMTSQGTILPLANPPQPSLNDLFTLMASSAVRSPTTPSISSPDMPAFNSSLPGISTPFSSFATLPLVHASDSKQTFESNIYSINQLNNFYSALSPPILEQQIPQDPINSAIFPPQIEMPSSKSIEIPLFPHLFPFNYDKSGDTTSSSISAPSSPPILTRIEDPIQNDDPDPPALKPEVVFPVEKDDEDQDQQDGTISTEKSGNFDLHPNEPPQLDQEGQNSLNSSKSENSSYTLPDSSTSQESLLNDTDTTTTDSSSTKVYERRLSLEDEPLLDSLETIKKFSDELNLSEADWLEIMTESRRRKLRPSTQANTVATLTKITKITKDHKNGRNGRKHRSFGSSELEMKNSKMARLDHQYNENESENQAPTSTTDLCHSPLSLDIDFYKNGIQNSMPSSSGISSSSNFSELSPKWKVLRRSKQGNTIWLGTQNFEDQKENVFLEQSPDEQIKTIRQKQHTGCAKKSLKKIKRIKSNWQPIGKPLNKLVRTCNDAFPTTQECYTSIRHRYETDEIIRVRDCIKVKSAEGLDCIGKVMNFYVDERGYLMASVLWYYTREQIDVIKNPLLVPLHEKELLASRHIDNVACDAIESIAFVLTFNEYCRYITEGQIDSLPICLRPLESQEVWPRGEEDYPRRSRLPHEDTPFEVVYFSRRVYDVKMKRVYVPKLTSTITVRPTLRLSSSLIRPTRASSH